MDFGGLNKRQPGPAGATRAACRPDPLHPRHAHRRGYAFSATIAVDRVVSGDIDLPPAVNIGDTSRGRVGKVSRDSVNRSATQFGTLETLTGDTSPTGADSFCSTEILVK